MRYTLALLLIASANLFAMSQSHKDLLNVKAAYDQGIDGAGEVIGIIDTGVDFRHKMLENKDVDYQKSQRFDRKLYPHGTHVASIMVGSEVINDDEYPFKPIKYRGIAYGAKISGIDNALLKNENDNAKKAKIIKDYFGSKPEIKVINNSWGSSLYPIIGYQVGGFHDIKFSHVIKKYTIAEALNSGGAEANALAELAREKKTLMVFAAGNEGMPSVNSNSAMAYYDESLRSWLSVGALNPELTTKSADGKISFKKPSWDNASKTFQVGFETTSNHFEGAELFSLLALGSNIKAADSTYRSNKTSALAKKTGTSMAAPMVSAAGALIAQKFPFMNGKQIADVLLSTANSNIETPKLIVKTTKISDTKKIYNVFYIDNDVPKLADGKVDKTKLKADLIEAGYGNVDDILNGIDDSRPLDKLELNNGGIVKKMSKESIIGQGLLDIGKAMGGLARLDANRLNTEDIADKIGKNEAYETIDLGSHDAVFSNDITQRKWDDKYHRIPHVYSEGPGFSTNLQAAANSPYLEMRNLDVGLIKKGDGKLTMNGKNTYQGATIVEKGELNLSTKADGSGGELVSSDVYVRAGAKFSGNGKIGKNLINEGTVRPGNLDFSSLSVGGTYTQKGANSLLQIGFDAKGEQGNAKLSAGAYDIQGGRLEYTPLRTEFYDINRQIDINLGALGSQIGKFSSVSVAETQTLKFTLDTTKLILNKKAEPPTNNQNATPPTQNGGANGQGSQTAPSGTGNSTQNPPTQGGTNNQNSPANPSQSGNSQNDPKISIVPKLKQDAYNVKNSDMGAKLREIRVLSDLSDGYKEAFGKIDGLSEKELSKSLNSIADVGSFKTASKLEDNHQKIVFNNMLFALNLTNIPASNFAKYMDKNPIKLASISDELTMNYLRDYKDDFLKRPLWYSTAGYKKYSASGLSGNENSLEIGVGTFGESSNTSFVLRNSSVKMSYEFSQSKSENLGFATSHVMNFDSFKFIGGASIDYSKNKIDRTIYSLNEKINAKYDGLIASVQIGAAKDMSVGKFTVMPIASFNYAYIRQNSFNESGKTFARNFDALNHHTLVGAIGLNISRNLELSDVSVNLSGYAMYEKRLSGINVKQKLAFKDFADKQFIQKHKLTSQIGTLGISSNFVFKNDLFLSLNGYGEFSDDKQRNFAVKTTIGYKF
ncbi:MAG: S8 family serine peptidase [Campylobacter sp.]